MIQIRLLENKKAAAACECLGLPVCGGYLVYEAMEGENAFGSCIFGITGSQGRFYRVQMNGDGLYGIADGLVRSALSLMVQRGVKEAVSDSTADAAGAIDAKLLWGTGFRQCGGQWHRTLSEGFFSGCGKAGNSL
jgi:hypothetical protein